LEAAYDSKKAAEDDVSGKGDAEEEESEEDEPGADGKAHDADAAAAAGAVKLRAARLRRANLATDLAVVASRLTKASRLAKRILDSRRGSPRTKGD
jgi:hypothetical protein